MMIPPLPFKNREGKSRDGILLTGGFNAERCERSAKSRRDGIFNRRFQPPEHNQKVIINKSLKSK